MNTIANKNNVFLVAEYFINKANKEGKPITNKKLQKLVYYAQAWSLVLNNKKLFSDKIEAWVHGPAIRTLYSKYKDFGFSPIKQDIKPEILEVFSVEDKKLLNSVWKVYGKLDSGYLEMLTHFETPWQAAREGLEGCESSSNEILPDVMKKYYLEKLKKARKH